MSDNPDDVAFADRPRCDGLTDPSPTLLGEEKSNPSIFDPRVLHGHTAEPSHPRAAQRAMWPANELLTRVVK